MKQTTMEDIGIKVDYGLVLKEKKGQVEGYILNSVYDYRGVLTHILASGGKTNVLEEISLGEVQGSKGEIVNFKRRNLRYVIIVTESTKMVRLYTNKGILLDIPRAKYSEALEFIEYEAYLRFLTGVDEGTRGLNKVDWYKGYREFIQKYGYSNTGIREIQQRYERVSKELYYTKRETKEGNTRYTIGGVRGIPDLRYGVIEVQKDKEAYTIYRELKGIRKRYKSLGKKQEVEDELIKMITSLRE